MPTAELNGSTTIGGLKLQSRITREAETALPTQVDLPAGKAGTLTTRTDDNTGVATLSNGHGVQSSDVVDVYWASGVRYGMTATVSGNLVTVDGGAGDVLPAETTAVVVTKQVVINVAFSGDAARLITVVADGRCRFSFEQSNGTVIDGASLVTKEAWSWWSGGPHANPLAGQTVGKMVASNAASSGTVRLDIGILYDSVA